MKSRHDFLYCALQVTSVDTVTGQLDVADPSPQWLPSLSRVFEAIVTSVMALTDGRRDIPQPVCDYVLIPPEVLIKLCYLIHSSLDMIDSVYKYSDNIRR